MPFSHAPITRRVDLCIAKIYLRDHQTCFFGAKVGGKLHLLRLEDDLLTPLRFNSQLIAAQLGSGRGQIGIAAGELGRELLFIGNSCFKFLLSCCVSLDIGSPAAFSPSERAPIRASTASLPACAATI